MDAGGLSREWMTLLVRSIFSREAPPSLEDDEARFVMRIDHLTPSEDARSNVKYFKDDKLSTRHISSLFLWACRAALTRRFTPCGYLPDPAVNYDLNQFPSAAALPCSRSNASPEATLADPAAGATTSATTSATASATTSATTSATASATTSATAGATASATTSATAGATATATATATANAAADLACLEKGEPRCASTAVSQNLRFIGRLIGRAVFDGIPLGIPLHPLV